MRRLYGGSLGFSTPTLYANFVSALDGVVALPFTPHSNRLIRAASEADRFVMALLRACADAVLIGAGTFRGSPHGGWTSTDAYPRAATSFAALRRRRHASETPCLAIMTNTGAIDCRHPALDAGALIFTTHGGAERLRGRVPASCTIVVCAGDTVDVRDAVAELRARGHRLILSESGPHVFGALVAAGLVDELFLTLSPILAGRAPAPPGESRERFGLVEGVTLLPERAVTGRLLSTRRHGSHLFLRYAVAIDGPRSSPRPRAGLGHSARHA